MKKSITVEQCDNLGLSHPSIEALRERKEEEGWSFSRLQKEQQAAMRQVGYFVVGAKNTTDPKVGAWLTEAEVNTLIEESMDVNIKKVRA